MTTSRRLTRLLAAGPIGALLAAGLALVPATTVQAQIVHHTRAAEAEPVKEFETIRQPFFCASVSIVGLLIHATVGSLGGDGRQWRNRAGLAA